MNIEKINTIYFSPTHTSAKICCDVAKSLVVKDENIIDYEITHEAPKEIVSFSENDIAVVAVPTYGGRVAPIAIERLRKFKGSKTLAVAIVLYGNRDYEDALLELCDELSELGFIPIAGGAFIGEHSYSRKNMPTAEGRPDVKDMEIASEFGKKIASKINMATSFEQFQRVSVKGKVPYRQNSAPTPDAPFVDDSLCVQCMLCVDNCPVQAISLVDNVIFCSPDKCIKCCRCVKDCPQEALTFNTPYTEKLHVNFSKYRVPELFL
ncbi:MAG: 4Fe-4S binding protein [Bacteroidetes bacterium]|nr:4Fe-4S binding protein [Bacteroidota bacterium]